MDVSIFLGLVVAGGLVGLSWLAKNQEMKQEQPLEMIERFEDRGIETGINMVVDILEKHKMYKRHRTLVHSMILMLMAKSNPEYQLDLLIPEDESEDIVLIGKKYIDKYATVSLPTKLDCFLAGVIEKEIDEIRIASSVCVQDVYELRKIVDSFYFRNL